MKKRPRRGVTAGSTRAAAPAHRPAPARPNLLRSEHLPPHPRQRRSLDNRARLKQAGLTLFFRRGYAGTSINQIAAEAGVAVGGVYLHFRTKQQLLVALMDDLLQALSDLDLRVDPSGDPRTALRDLLARAFASDLAYLGAYRAWQEAILTDPDLARRQREITAWTTARVVRVFKALQTVPGARKGVDVEGLASVVDTLLWAVIADALRLSKTELDHRLDSVTHIVFHALFRDRA
jgi:AcrR family transcriptional regulator